MGNITSNFKKSLTDLFSVFRGKKKASIAILGLDSSGKSTLVNLFRDTNIPTVPTLGFNVEEVVVCSTTIRIWDVGGQKEFISYWREYVQNIDGLVFMIDIADNDRFETSYEDGFQTIVPHIPQGIPILLLLNKADLISDTETLNSRIREVKTIYDADNRKSGADSFIKANESFFKSRVMAISVKDDLEKMASMGSSWSIQDSSVFPGFKWLIDGIKNREASP